MSKVKPAPLPPDTVIGGYRVVRRLAAGGFGVVYLAVDNEGQQVAVKEYLPSSLATRPPGELLPQVQPEKLSLYRLGLKSFFEEGRSLAQISHPSVVSVLNFFRENETVYMVMNYLEGATLQDFIVTARDLKKQKVFRESTIRSLFDEVLRGLRIVHQHKMLHLDIKPANIFITDENRAVMIDFGAAREVLSKEGNFIRPMYTPGFAAPEMYRRDSSMGPWTDIYAIGACIYACMQGYPPNDAPQRLEKDRLSLSLSRQRGVYSDNLIEVVEWCMSLDPLSRPQSVFALQKRNSVVKASGATPSSVWAKRSGCSLTPSSPTPRRTWPRARALGRRRNEVFSLSGQPKRRSRQERRPHGLLLHAGILSVCPGGRHGRPS
jgi:serine/threonine protein kinase